MTTIPDDDFDEDAIYSKEALAPVSRTPFPVGGNPLLGYFRVPGVHVQLPTRGAFMPTGSITMAATGGVPVLPMRAQDELLLKSPDALMSGYAITALLESCIPGLQNAKLISTPDLDVLLLAIRTATYGDKMGLTVICPKCEVENSFDCDLPSLLSNVSYVERDPHVRLSDDIVAYVRPYNVADATAMALATYEETQKLRALEQDDTARDEQVKAMNTSMARLTKLKYLIMAASIIKVVVPGAEVTDRKHITDFVCDAPKPYTDKLEKKLDKINNKGLDKRIEVECASCQHKWKTEIEFNPASFFEGGSSA